MAGLEGIVRPWEGCSPATGALGTGCVRDGTFGARCDRSASLNVRVPKFPPLLIVTFVAPVSPQATQLR
jgi:hypothetical protein